MNTETIIELTEEEVAELVADAPAPNNGEVFVPTDAGGVDWVLRKMNAARAEAKLIRDNAELMARSCERQAEALDKQKAGIMPALLLHCLLLILWLPGRASARSRLVGRDLFFVKKNAPKPFVPG